MIKGCKCGMSGINTYYDGEGERICLYCGFMLEEDPIDKVKREHKRIRLIDGKEDNQK